MKTTKKNDEFTLIEKEFLRRDAFISEVIKKRQLKSPIQSFWERFLESKVGTALITVLAGGIITVLITGIIQRWQSERDFSNEIVSLYSKQQLDLYKVALNEKTKFINNTLLMAGSTKSKVENLIETNDRSFAYKGKHDDAKQEEKEKIDNYNDGIKNQISQVKKDYNVAVDNWETHKPSTQALIGYYFSTEASKIWLLLVNSMDSYIECATSHRMAIKDSKCKKSRLIVEEYMLAITSSFYQAEKNLYELDADKIKKIRKLLEDTEK